MHDRDSAKDRLTQAGVGPIVCGVGTDWFDSIEEARTAETRMARVEEWVDQRHGDLGLDNEPPRYVPTWERVLTVALFVIIWAAIIVGIVFGG